MSLTSAFTVPVSYSSASSSSFRRAVVPTTTTTSSSSSSSKTTVRLAASTGLTSSSSSSANNIGIPLTKSTGNKRLAAGMAALTGWADVVLHLKLGTFCTMMTGNTMWLAKAMTDLHWSNGVYYVMVLSSYCIGLALYRTWQNQTSTTMLGGGSGGVPEASSSTSRPSTKTRFLVKMAMSVVTLFTVADYFWHTYPTSAAILQKWIPASFLAIAFALINGVGNDTAGTMTFVLTGHMTKFIYTLVDTPISKWWNLLQTNGGIHMNLSVIFGFFLGAFWGNLLRHWGLLSANFTYMGILLAILFLWKDSILKKVENGGTTNVPTKWYKKLPTQNQ